MALWTLFVGFAMLMIGNGLNLAVLGVRMVDEGFGVRAVEALQIALHKLPRRGPQNVFAGNFWMRCQHRHGILQLVTKTISTAGLIET